MKLEKILVIEDNPKHLEDAKEFFKAKEGLKVDYATTLKETEELLDKTSYDGIICDIFFPSGKESSEDIALRNQLYDALIKYAPRGSEISIESWRSGEIKAPMGVYVAEIAKERRIPFVFCTDTYHHGDKTEPVYSYASDIGKMSVVDCEPDGEDMNKVGTRKDFEKAFNAKGTSVRKWNIMEECIGMQYLFKGE